MTILPPDWHLKQLLCNQCELCEHLNRHRLDRADTCDAFMGGIPAEIWNNIQDHREPYEGDKGIRWEPYGLVFKHPMDD